MEYLFTSERLGFRTWKESDLDPYAELCAAPKVMEYFPSTQNRAHCIGFIERNQKHFETYNRCFFAVDLLDNQEFIGFIGIIHQTMEADFTPCDEIGWRLKQSVWNKGYATEGAKRCLEYGFQTLGLKKIYSITPLLNKKSEYLMQKLGMKKEGEFMHPKLEKGHALEAHVFYSLERKTDRE